MKRFPSLLIFGIEASTSTNEPICRFPKALSNGNMKRRLSWSLRTDVYQCLPLPLAFSKLFLKLNVKLSICAGFLEQLNQTLAFGVSDLLNGYASLVFFRYSIEC